MAREDCEEREPMSEGSLGSSSGATPGPQVVMARAAKQRERILDAAEQCFIKHGFHAASMADIAQTAEMSAGLIYRYFANKAAIVKAIIERHLESEHHQKICKLNSADDISRALLEVFDSWRRRDDPKLNATLMLELTAESTRDPEIARAVRSKDKALGASITDVVRRSARARGVTLTPAAARSRAVLLQCLVEGLAMRVVRDPKLLRATIKPALEAIVDALMS
jgi:AcrR family transcriptional regulator